MCFTNTHQVFEYKYKCFFFFNTRSPKFFGASICRERQGVNSLHIFISIPTIVYRSPNIGPNYLWELYGPYRFNKINIICNGN